MIYMNKNKHEEIMPGLPKTQQNTKIDWKRN